MRNVPRNAKTVAMFLTLAVCFGGCGHSGPTLHPVIGKVTFRGEPVKAGTVRFRNAKAAIDITARLTAEGAYTIIGAQGKGLPEGDYEVAVMPPEVPLPMGPVNQLPPPPECKDIPKNYRQPSTSKLTARVTANAGSFDFDLR